MEIIPTQRGFMPGTAPAPQAGFDTTNQQQPQPTATDQSQPLPGADTLAKPAGFGATLGDARGWNTVKPSSFVSNTAKAANQLTQAQGPEAAAQPGNWARTLVGGAVSALGGGLAALGDAAAVGTIPHGGGALTGVARTLGARNQRMTQQREENRADEHEKSLMAEANIRMVHNQKLIHQLDESEQLSNIEEGKKMIQHMNSAASRPNVIGTGMTSDELQKYLQDNKIDASKETAYPDGRKVVGANKDGSPIYRTTYTAMGVPPDVDLRKVGQDVVDDLNKYAPLGTGKYSTDMTMSGPQFNMAMEQVSGAKAAEAAVRAKSEDEELSAADRKQRLEIIHAVPDWGKALSQTGNDPLKALENMQNDPAMREKYPNLENDVRTLYGDKRWDSWEKSHEQEVTGGLKEVQAWEKALVGASPDHAATIAGQIQQKLDDTKNPLSDVVRQRMEALVKQANAGTKSNIEFTKGKKLAEEEATQKSTQEDTETLLDMALKYQKDPDQLFSRFKGLKEKREFLAEMHRRDPEWSEAKYKERYNQVVDMATNKPTGKALVSFNQFAGHTGRANEQIQTLRNTNLSPYLNKGLNELKVAIGNDKFSAFKADIEAVKDEYLAFLKNNHVPGKEELALADNILNSNATPNTIQNALREMAHVVMVRGRSLNYGYRKVMDKDIPNILDPESQQVFRTFGIDPNDVYGQGGNLSKPQESTKPGQPGVQLPPVSQGMARVKLPSGKFMDFQAGSDQYKQAIGHGAIAAQ